MFMAPFTLRDVPSIFAEAIAYNWRHRGGRLTDEEIEYIVGATTAAVEEAMLLPEVAANDAVRRTVAGALDAIGILTHQLKIARGGR